MSKKVSIVVPIYNVEQYLEKCIESIINQTYKDLEIILVDDGSTDDSPSICDKWKELDLRVSVIHKKNGGLSSARNAGLELATGDYIMFEDSDDWLELNIVEKCVNRAEIDQSDLVVFGYKKINENYENVGEFTFGDATYSNKEISHQLHNRILEMSFGYAWNKLYRLSTIKESGVKNNSNIIDREDLYFNLSLFKYINKVSYLNCIGYNYLQRGNSLLHNADLARLKKIDFFFERIKELHWGESSDEKKVINMVLLHYLSDVLIKNIIWNNDLRKKEKIIQMKKIVQEVKWNFFRDKDNPRYLNLLYIGIKKRRLIYLFYNYVLLSSYLHNKKGMKI